MEVGKHLKIYQNSAIVSFYKADYRNSENPNITGISIQSIVRWTKYFYDFPNGDFQLQNKSKGRPKSISPRTLKFLKRQVET